MTANEVMQVMDLFSNRLRLLLDRHDITQLELSEILSVSPSTVNKWLAKKSVPRMGVIEKMSAYFGVPKSYFLEADTDVNTRSYYFDPETAALAQELKANPQYRVMMDSTRKLSPEAVKEVMKFIEFQRMKEDPWRADD